MIKILQIVNPYAAWRAECCKADLDNGWCDEEKQHKTHLDAEHRAKHRASQRAYLAHKKAARDCTHKAANKKLYTKSITA